MTNKNTFYILKNVIHSKRIVEMTRPFEIPMFVNITYTFLSVAIVIME